jgi:uncharacterized protein YhjY with autotransporter beta-barrel domain
MAPGAQAQSCAPSGTFVCYYYQQPAPAPQGSNTGDPGQPGTAAPPVTFNFGSATYPGDAGIGSSGGMGGLGRDSDYGTEDNGGDGGIGGSGSSVTIIMPSGLVVQGQAIFQALGGQGGVSGHGSKGGAHGTGGHGAAGGTLVVGSALVPALGLVTTTQWTGLTLLATGGSGAGGVSYDPSGLGSNYDGGDAGNGGKGGSAQLVFAGTVGGNLAGIAVSASGGDGGGGGTPHNIDDANGGNGGNGGAGGQAAVVFAAGAQWAPGFATGIGIMAASHGGQGGAGGPSGGGSGGIAGTGGNAGSVFVQNDGAIQTGYDNSPGILAQAFGGVGANGGKGGGWGASGGYGGTGGTGGIINIVGGTSGSIVTAGTNAQGIMAQSIGGGGGNGGDSDGWMAVGGDGGVAANGGPVNVVTSNSITTAGDHAGGIMAQSIGGGGGNGGDAKGIAGVINITIGGIAGNGGDANTVIVASSGAISTKGIHASGLILQAIGGGGGNGGAAYGTTYSTVGGAQVSIGGSGGNGGNGGTIELVGGSTATNSGQILTFGNNAHGIVAQSIGGGGGIGGAALATATTFAVPAPTETPSVSLAVALGGVGGNGGAGFSVTVSNSGLLMMGGAGSHGMLLQSIGGGGGAGGDASAAATAQGSGALNLSGSLAIGGTGAGGGNGGTVAGTNSGMIVTAGGSAHGMLLQSIGGGGGAGGIGDANASSDSNASYTVSLTLGMGGGGGAGGNGGIVNATNSGPILTMGDGAVGIMAQSIGGGGGAGGGAGGAAGSSTFSASVNVGGDGGRGGSAPQDAKAVTVANSGTIVTFGADAAGIHAQSIAGGGGAGGKTASNMGSPIARGDGGVGTFSMIYGGINGVATAYTNIKVDPDDPNSQDPAAAYNSVVGMLGIAGKLLGVSGAITDNLSGLESMAGELGSIYEGKYVPTLGATIGVGGKGGAGGTAGDVTVTNTGSIGTMGSMSDAIIAQSIGGGGGKGGASSTNSTGQVDAQAEVSVGGTGGAGGAGGNVIITNSGEIITIGGHSAGIVAQSIGGGGGIGGVAGVTSSANLLNSLLSVPIAVGGSGGGTSSAGNVTITNSANITTLSHNSIGIIAQSIAGGGGIVKSFSLSPGDNAGGGASVTGGSFGINGFQFGGDGGATGTAGLVSVSHLAGTISTGGRNAYGILAQSIGGGGGLSLGGMPNGTSFFGSGKMTGSGQDVSVTLGDGTTPASIATTGQGAVGIFAQSIGGGGGVAGDTALLSALMPFTPTSNHDGGGGTVTINVNSGASVTTGAESTPAILAQSIGGGGGRVTNTRGAFSGTAGGFGQGGLINISVGGTVSAAGLGSPAIYAESAGFTLFPPTSLPITVVLEQGAMVSGGTDVTTGDGTGAGIYLVGGGVNVNMPNTVTNFGTITSVDATSGTAIYSANGYTQVTNESGGTITGNISLSNGGGGGNITNNDGGTLNMGAQVALGNAGVLRNRGTLQVGEPRQIAATQLTGTLVQEAGGRMLLDTDHAAGRADMVTVEGRATLAGRIEARPITLSKAPVTVLTASGGIDLDPAATGYRSPVFDLKPISDGTSLHIQPSANFFGSGRLSATQLQVAAHLQEAWNNGESLGTGFATLAGVKDGGSYVHALDTLSGQTIGAIAAARFAASQAFVSNMQSCPDLTDATLGQRERDCVWGRVTGNATVQDTLSGSLGYRASAVTAQIGGQHEFRPDWFLGGSLAYERSRFSGGRGTSTVNGDSVLGGLVLKHQRGGWLFSGALDAGYGSYDSTRQIVMGDAIQSATGSPNAWHLGATARLSYRVAMGDWYVKPMAELRVAHMAAGAYTEGGWSPFRLAVAGESATMLTATGAVEIGTRIDLGSFGTLLPFASLGLSVNGEDGWAVTARFAGAQGATAGFRATTPIPNALGRVSVGANLATAGNLELKLQYNGDFGDRYSSHTGLARLAVRF